LGGFPYLEPAVSDSQETAPSDPVPVVPPDAVAAPISYAIAEISPLEEYNLGRAVASNILSSYKTWSAKPELVDYANKICAAIALNSPKPDPYNGYHVMLLDSDEINAFATPGGHIFITRGLFSSANSEDALAAVIAHEISHIQMRHSVKAITTNRITRAIMASADPAAEKAEQIANVTGLDLHSVTEIFGESAGDMVSALVNYGYAQVQEFNADYTAVGLLAAAGYNPGGLTDMLRELEKSQKDRSGGFNKTHPSPGERLSEVKTAVDLFHGADTASFRQDRFNAVK
jgi:predicted Zn-dependent protease